MDRQEWLLERRTGVGASDAPAVCGLSPWKTPLHIYLDKTGDLEDADTAPKKWGRRLEDVIAQAYQEETGHEVMPPTRAIERHPERPWLLCSPDRMVWIKGWTRRLLECKNVRQDSEEWGEPGSGLVPAHYLLQCQHQMYVTGVDACDLAALFGGQELRVYALERDEEVLARLLPILEAFWRRVERRDPPPPCWEHPETPELVKAISRSLGVVEAAEPVALGHDLVPAVCRFSEVKRELSALEKEKESLYARLLHAMGQAGRAHLPSGHELVRSCRHRKSHTVKESDYIEMRIKEPKR